ncbi:MAG: TIGR02186 family protein [Siculibacillus sp.]|nr:TIGR02186 family protein [Siculibacillus sp.]
MTLRRAAPFLGLAVILAAILAAPAPTLAETLVAEVSTKRVAISSNFSGTDITVYGAIERDGVTVSRAAGYDIAVMLIGPRRTMVTRRKDRVLGLWINRDWRTYDAPTFYALATTKPLAELATPQVLDAQQIGMENLILPEGIPGGIEVMAGAAEFRDAFLAQQRKAGHYVEYPSTVRFLGSQIFAVTLPIPAEVPVGSYTARVVLIADGSPVAEHVSTVDVAKIGFEQQVTDLATRRGVVYGLASVVIALMTGWLGGVLFRRD